MWHVIDRYPRKGFAIRRVTTGEIYDIYYHHAQAARRCAFLNHEISSFKEDTNEHNNQQQQEVAP